MDDLGARLEALEKQMVELHDEVWAELQRYAQHINETFATLSENVAKSVSELLAPMMPLVAMLGAASNGEPGEAEPCEVCGAEMDEDADETCPECGWERTDG